MIDVYEVNPTTMRFRIRNPSARARIIRRGLWDIAGVPLVVHKWDPKTEEEKQEEADIPMWVYLKKVPLSMYSWEGLSFISSDAGFPVRLHPETTACTNFETAKVFVRVDVSKELPKKVNFTKDGKKYLVEFIYPWLPLRCSVCGKWGHSEKVCVAQQKQEEPVKEATEETGRQSEQGSLVATSGEKEVAKEVSETVEVPLEEESSKALSNEEYPSLGKRKEGSVTGVDDSWISPSKKSRSPVMASQAKSVPIASVSKFAVINNDKEEGELMEESPTSSLETDSANVIVKEAEEENSLSVAASRTSRKIQKETSSTSTLSHKDVNSIALSTRSSTRRNC